VRARGIDVVVDLFGSLDPGVPTDPNSILYIYWPILDEAALPALGILGVLVDAVVRLIHLGTRSWSIAIKARAGPACSMRS
jgi:hypothetical protein